MQGIGYLDDGTMVVIDEAKDFVGSRLDMSSQEHYKPPPEEWSLEN